MGDEAAVFRKTATLNGAYTIDAGLAALARQIVLKKAAADSAQIISMLGIQEES